MSQDLLLGNTSRDWSRDLSGADNEASDKSPLTEKEKNRIEKLAKLEMLASKGDPAAKKKMVLINAALATIQKKAAKGDAQAKRLLAVLQDKGLVVLSESSTGPRLVMAGVYGRTRRPRQPQQQGAQQAPVNPAEQVQEFLVNLKMRAMAGDPQAAAVLQQYQQILMPPGAAQAPDGMPPQPGEGMSPPEGYPQGGPMATPEGYPPQGPPPGYPQGYPQGAPMAGDDADSDRQARRQARRQKIQLLKSRAAAGDAEATAALQILQERRAQRHAQHSSSDGSFVGFNGHLAFIRGLGEEEIALAREGGSCERAALKRRMSSSLTSSGYGQAAIAVSGPDMTVPGLILAMPIIMLIEYFSNRSDKKAADAQARAAATQAVNNAIARGLTSGPEFLNAAYLTFGWQGDYGSSTKNKDWKYNKQVDDGVPEVRASVVKKVRAGDKNAIAFYKAVLNTGYTPKKNDPGLARLS